MVITLDRPERRNAVDLPSLQAPRRGAQRGRRAAGSGRRADRDAAAFCAGADLDGVEDSEFTSTLQAVLRGFTELPIPVIGAIDGPALGAGAQLASVCDLRVATSRSRFGIPAAKLGLAVDQWTANRVSHEFTPPIARAMLLAAETYDGERLYEAGVDPPHRRVRRGDELGPRDRRPRAAHDRRPQAGAGTQRPRTRCRPRCDGRPRARLVERRRPRGPRRVPGETGAGFHGPIGGDHGLGRASKPGGRRRRRHPGAAGLLRWSRSTRTARCRGSTGRVRRSWSRRQPRCRIPFHCSRPWPGLEARRPPPPCIVMNTSSMKPPPPFGVSVPQNVMTGAGGRRAGGRRRARGRGLCRTSRWRASTCRGRRPGWRRIAVTQYRDRSSRSRRQDPLVRPSQSPVAGWVPWRSRASLA